jgi:hypothetical protein
MWKIKETKGLRRNDGPTMLDKKNIKEKDIIERAKKTKICSVGVGEI